MITVESIASSLAFSFGEEYSDLDVKEVWDTWVADALDTLLQDEWPFKSIVGQITTVDEQQIYVAPDNVWDVDRIAIPGSAPLVQTTRKALLDQGEDLSKAGTPTSWFPAGVETTGEALIGLWPVPATDDADVAYTVLGGTLSNITIVDTTVELLVPPDLVTLLKYLVKESYYEHVGNVELSNANHAKYLRGLPLARKRHMALGDHSRRAQWTDVPDTYVRTGPRMPSNYA